MIHSYRPLQNVVADNLNFHARRLSLINATIPLVLNGGKLMTLSMNLLLTNKRLTIRWFNNNLEFKLVWFLVFIRSVRVFTVQPTTGLAVLSSGATTTITQQYYELAQSAVHGKQAKWIVTKQPTVGNGTEAGGSQRPLALPNTNDDRRIRPNLHPLRFRPCNTPDNIAPWKE